MNSIDQNLVATRFCNALSSYDHAAIPQHVVAGELAGMIAGFMTSEPQSILEIGCGTGLFTQAISGYYPTAEYTLNDLVSEAEQTISAKLPSLKYRFISGDAEHSGWDIGYELVASSSCVQWWQEPTAFLTKAYDVLAEGGVVALSTYLPGNLSELSTLLPHALRYPDASQYIEKLSAYRRFEQKEVVSTLYFPTLLHLLRHLKETGTNAFTQSQRGVWSPARLAKAEQLIRQDLELVADAPLPLTYKALLIVAEK